MINTPHKLTRFTDTTTTMIAGEQNATAYQLPPLLLGRLLLLERDPGLDLSRVDGGPALGVVAVLLESFKSYCKRAALKPSRLRCYKYEP